MNTTIYYCSPNVGKFENNNLFYPSLIESGGKVTDLLGHNEKLHSSDKFSIKAKEKIKHEALNTLFISLEKRKLPVAHFPWVFVLHLASPPAYSTTLPSFCKTSRSEGFSSHTVFDSQAYVPFFLLITRFPFNLYWETPTLEFAVLLSQIKVSLQINSTLLFLSELISKPHFFDLIEFPFSRVPPG